MLLSPFLISIFECRKVLHSNDYLFAKIGVDTAENQPLKVPGECTCIACQNNALTCNRHPKGWTQERLVEDIRAIGRGHDNNLPFYCKRSYAEYGFFSFFLKWPFATQ